MFPRMPVQIARPWIKRPRGATFLMAALVILTNSSAFAQRGGAGCGGTGGSTGTSGFGATGGFGVAGGFNGQQGGFANPAQVQMMVAAQQMQAMPNGYGYSDIFDGENYNLDPKAKKALRAEKAAASKKRFSARSDKPVKGFASRTKPKTAG